MASPQTRAKRWGYAVEVAAAEALGFLFPGIRRTGSVAYKKAAADLIRPGENEVRRLVVTRDKRRPLLVTLSIPDLVHLVFAEKCGCEIAVQVKGRERTWIGRLYDELTEATKKPKEKN